MSFNFSSLLQTAERSCPFGNQKEVQQKKSFQKASQKNALLPSIPQYKSVSTSEDEAEQAPAARGRYTDPTPTPIPRDDSTSMEQEETGKEEDSPGYATPPEAMGMTTQQQHTALSNQLDRALQEALDQTGPSCLKKQGGGDREPTPGPRIQSMEN